MVRLSFALAALLATAACASRPPPLSAAQIAEARADGIAKRAAWDAMTKRHEGAWKQAFARQDADDRVRAEAMASCRLQATTAGAGFHGFGWNGFFNSMAAEARVANACEAAHRAYGTPGF